FSHPGIPHGSYYTSPKADPPAKPLQFWGPWSDSLAARNAALASSSFSATPRLGAWDGAGRLGARAGRLGKGAAAFFILATRVPPRRCGRPVSAASRVSANPEFGANDILVRLLAPRPSDASEALRTAEH